MSFIITKNYGLGILNAYCETICNWSTIQLKYCWKWRLTPSNKQTFNCIFLHVFYSAHRGW